MKLKSALRPYPRGCWPENGADGSMSRPAGSLARHRLYRRDGLSFGVDLPSNGGNEQPGYGRGAAARNLAMADV
jgi:hypothetical protein